MKLIFIFLLMTGLALSQNLIYEATTWTSGAVSDTLDLGSDVNKILSDYGSSTQEEVRVIGLWFDGTWTNTSLTVLACTTLAGTYDAVTDIDGTALTITMASNTWVYLEPRFFAGLRYIRLLGSAEGGARTLVVIKRRY
jgi:hypothetical protein